MLEILTKRLADFVAGDWDGVKAATADDVIYEELSTQMRVVGRENYLDILQRWRRAFPDVKCTVLGGFASGEHVVAEVEWQGTQTGPLDMKGQVIPPTNKRVTVRAALVAKIRDGKLIEEHHYFDMYKLLAELGVAPGLPAVPPAAKPASAAIPKA